MKSYNLTLAGLLGCVVARTGAMVGVQETALLHIEEDVVDMEKKRENDLWMEDLMFMEEHEANDDDLALIEADEENFAFPDAGSIDEDQSTSLEVDGFHRVLQEDTRPLTRWCRPVVVDFDTDGAGNELEVGEYVQNEWRRAYGLKVTARGRNGGYTPDSKPRLFDSENPGSFTQLGTPNKKCPSGGKGNGNGGHPGKSGENCDRQGLVLIIQDTDTPYCKDTPNGGFITFTFDEPSAVSSIGLLDINTSATKVYVVKSDRSRKVIKVPRRGNNSAQTLPIFQTDVVRVIVSLKNNGAITHLTFCPSGTLPPTQRPTARPTMAGDCTPTKVVHKEDFEGRNPLRGWTNGKIDYDRGFTKFLGRFIKNDADPHKTYTVNKNADAVVIEFDFYEIDSWNSDSRYGPDCIYVWIDGEKLDLGVFASRRDEGTRRGVTTNGIAWLRQSQGPPRHIGFRDGRDYYVDQIHHITALVLRKFYETDGELKLTFNTQVTATTVRDESAGYDNIVVTEKYDCDGSTPRPTQQPVVKTGRPTPQPIVKTPQPTPTKRPTPQPVATTARPTPQPVIRTPRPTPTKRPTPQPVAKTDRPSPSTDRPTTRGPTTAGCVPSVTVHQEDFEDGLLTGWRNGLIAEAPVFTKFLGRYANENSGPGKDPFKEFENIPKDAAFVVLHFDFYEIDSWNASQRDYACVVIDHKAIDLGTFDEKANESGRRGTRHGMSFHINSRAPPLQIGFSRSLDQIHRVKVTIPRNFYQRDGKLKIMFQVRVNMPKENESGGFDNIRLVAKFDCDSSTARPAGQVTRQPTARPTRNPTPGGCVPSVVIYQENFETGLPAGWFNGKVESATGFTQFLGRYTKANSGLGKDPFKTYTGIPIGASSVLLEFDFYEIDGWDSDDRDCVYVLVDTDPVFLGIFDEHSDESGRTDTTERGIKWTIRSTPPQNIGFSSSKDQIHHVTAEVPRSFYSRDGALRLMFQTRVNEEDVDDESGGFDNIKITAKFNCDIVPLPIVDPQPIPLPGPGGRYRHLESNPDNNKEWEDEAYDEGFAKGARVGGKHLRG